MPNRIKYIRTATMQKTPIGEETDVFSADGNGLVPKSPQNWVSEGGVEPHFAYWGLDNNNKIQSGMEDMWEAVYDHSTATISGIKYTRPQNAPKNIRAILFGLNKAKMISGTPYLCYVVLGVAKRSGIGLVCYDATSGVVSLENSTGRADSFTTEIGAIASNTEYEIEVSETAFSVTVNGTKTTVSLPSNFQVRFANLGYVAHGNASASYSFKNVVNLEAGEGHYEADTEKTLFSDAKWKEPPVNPRSFPSDFKTALLNCFRHCTWLEDDDGAEFISALAETMASSTSGGEGWESGVSYSDIETVDGERVVTTYGLGYVESAEGWSRTGYVPCGGASKITFSAMPGSAANVGRCYFYSGSAIAIQQFSLSISQDKEISVPDGAEYFMISGETAALESCLEDGITPFA